MPTTRYANTDLDLVAAFDVSELVEVLGARCHLLSFVRRESQWFATIEASPDSSNIDDPHRSADRDLTLLLSAVGTLSGVPLEQWRLCEKRVLNIGFECGDTWAFECTIRTELLAAAARVGCSISVTLYPLPSDASSTPPEPE